MSLGSIHKWYPLTGLEENSNNQDCALVILNRPITSSNEQKFIKLWRSSNLKFAVDGGTNQLFNWASQQFKIKSFLPNFICGDLDSVDPEKLDFYSKHGSVSVRLSHQDYNDFTKTLKFAVECISKCNRFDLIDSISPGSIDTLPNQEINKIYCFCENGGRMDHVLGNLNTLYDECLNDLETYVADSESLTFLLKKGLNIIFFDRSLVNRHCGLIAIGAPTKVTTLGFKWDLDRKTLRFGNFISTSNEFEFIDIETRRLKFSKLFSHDPTTIDFDTCNVFVETNEPLIFTMSIK